jgi:hypothetical protein
MAAARASRIATSWTFIILALPLLYVVTQPPIYMALSNWNHDRTLVWTPAPSTGFQWGNERTVAHGTWTIPGWLIAYDKPYKWLETKPVIGQPVYRYRVWWAEHYNDYF